MCSDSTGNSKDRQSYSPDRNFDGQNKSGPQILRAARVLQTTNLELELSLQLNCSRRSNGHQDDAMAIRQTQVLVVVNVEELGFKVENQVSP